MAKRTRGSPKCAETAGRGGKLSCHVCPKFVAKLTLRANKALAQLLQAAGAQPARSGVQEFREQDGHQDEE